MTQWKVQQRCGQLFNDLTCSFHRELDTILHGKPQIRISTKPQLFNHVCPKPFNHYKQACFASSPNLSDFALDLVGGAI